MPLSFPAGLTSRVFLSQPVDELRPHHAARSGRPQRRLLGVVGVQSQPREPGVSVWVLSPSCLAGRLTCFQPLPASRCHVEKEVLTH